MLRWLVAVWLVFGLVGCSATEVANTRGKAVRTAARTHASSPVGRTPDAPKTAAARGAPAIPDMEVLYRRESSTGDDWWQLCALRLPAGKVEVLLDSRKLRRRLGAVLDQARFSPDGRQVLFTASDAKSSVGITTDFAYGSSELLDLWLYDRATKRIRRLTTDRQGYNFMKWSLDGLHVSASGARGSTEPDENTPPGSGVYMDLYAWNVRTGRRHMVVQDVNTNQWSRDSRYLLALRNDWRLYVWNAETGTKDLAATSVRDALWMADSKGLLLVKMPPDGWWYSPVAGGRTRLLLKEPVAVADFAAPVLSPDGKKLSYLNDEYDTRILTLATGKSVPASLRWPSAAKRGSSPDTRWSPDSMRIAQVTVGGMYDPAEGPTTPMAAMDARTGELLVQRTFKDTAALMGWSRDSKTVFIANTVTIVKPADSKGNLVGIPQPLRVFAWSASTGFRDVATLPTPDALRRATYLDWRLLSP